MAGSTAAEPLTVSGVAGYLSEWQLSGNLTEAASGGEYIGPLDTKHIGLCSHDGPDEKVSDIKLRVTGLKPSSQIRATLVMDGQTCNLEGPFSGTYTGFMDCSNAKGVPVTLSVK